MINNTITRLVEVIYEVWRSAGLDGDFPDGLWFQRAPSRDLLIQGDPPSTQWQPYVVFDIKPVGRKRFTSAFRGICEYEVKFTAYCGQGITAARVLMERLNNIFSAGFHHLPSEPTYYVLSILEAQPSKLNVDKDLKLGIDVLTGELTWTLLVNEQKELVNIN